MRPDNTTLSITIKDIELRTQKQRKLPGARRFYVQISISKTLQSTISAKEVKNRTSWNEQFLFDVHDRPDICIDVYQKHHLGSDEKVGSHIASGVFEELREEVLEYTLRKGNSDGSNPSGATIKFALAARSRTNPDADEVHGEEIVALTTEGAKTSSPTPSDIDHLVFTAGSTSNLLDMPQTTRLEHPLGRLLDRIALLDNIVTDIVQIHPYVSLAYSVLSGASKVLGNQKSCDNRIVDLVSRMDDVLDFVEGAEPLKIVEAHTKTIRLLVQQVTECGYFVTQYAKRKDSWTQATLARYVASDISSSIAAYEDKFRELKTSLLDGVAIQTGIIVRRMMNAMNETMESMDLNDLPYALGARFQPEKGCLPGTRESFLREICDVLNDPTEDAPQVCFLTGVTGSGKSAVAHTIARLYDDQRRLGSSFFFSKSDAARRNPQNLFSTIARDLADHDPQFKTALWATVKHNRALRGSQSPIEQVEKLIIEPSEFIDIVGPLVIVIDALDESGDRASRQQLLRIISEKIIENAFPTNFRFFITSRAEDDIITKLRAGPHIVHKDMSHIPNDLVDEDIEKFIFYSLQDYTDLLSSGPHTEWCQLLVHHSQHLFQWASTACNFIKGDDAVGFDPCERLDELLEAASTDGVHSLDKVYQTILAQLFTSETSRERFRAVMTIMLALNEPLSMHSLSALLGGDPSVRRIIKPMGSLLDGVIDEEKPILPLHTSFRDFLLDETRSSIFHVSIQHQHSLRLAKASLQCIQNMLPSNISDLENSLVHSITPDPPARVKQTIPPHIAYSCRYWVNHLQLAGPLLDMLKDITLLLSTSNDTTFIQQPSCDSPHGSKTTPAAIVDVVNYAFSYIVESGDLQMAVEFLEQARGILWNQLACFDTSVTALENRGGKGRELANRFTQLSSNLRGNSESSGSERDAYLPHGVKEEWQSTVNKIRQMDGFSRFLLPARFEYLQQAASRGPVVVLNASKYICDALIVLSAEQPIHVPLTSCPPDKLARLYSTFFSLVRSNGENEQEVGRFLRDLWTSIVAPIVKVLRDEIKLPQDSRIWWCPASQFTALPLHAAGPYAKGKMDLMDFYPSSYTPSLSALIRARERAQKMACDTSGDSTAVTFAVVGQSYPDISHELPGVEMEIFKVQNETNMPANVKFETIIGDAATIDGAIQAFHDYHWIHLACHGKQDPQKPFDSGFAMRDGRLTLMRIIQEQYTCSEFAFLSACHSAVGNESTPDEVLHLAAGMQFAGFNGVVGTLCRVDDTVAHEVVTRFYREMFRQPVINSEYAAKALHIAVTEAEGVSFFQRRVVFMHIGI